MEPITLKDQLIYIGKLIYSVFLQAIHYKKNVMDHKDKDPFYYLARVGKMGEYDIYVHYEDEYQTPHFHMVREGQPDICLKIETAEYADHGNNAGKLDGETLRQLDEFFKGYRMVNISYWDYVIIKWNNNNDTVKVDPDQPLTDYTKLEVHEEG